MMMVVLLISIQLVFVVVVVGLKKPTTVVLIFISIIIPPPTNDEEGFDSLPRIIAILQDLKLRRQRTPSLARKKTLVDWLVSRTSQFYQIVGAQTAVARQTVALGCYELSLQSVRLFRFGQWSVSTRTYVLAPDNFGPPENCYSECGGGRPWQQWGAAGR